ncbi:hypothetical protein Rhein_3885 [Rheinheimera sp. A13L]|nr:hypothetical protein Rhein_3885 [Rheinheimera sp. A13L]
MNKKKDLPLWRQFTGLNLLGLVRASFKADTKKAALRLPMSV